MRHFLTPRTRLLFKGWRTSAGAVLLLFFVLATSPALLAGPRQVPASSASAEPIAYRVTFPAPEHHWMQVEVTLSKLPRQSLDVRMSRSSPGRYAVAEFAKNIFSFEAYDSKGKKLEYARPDPDVWRVSGHDGTVRIVYKIFGDY